MVVNKIEVDGLDHLRRQLKDLGDKDLPKGLQQANKSASAIVAETARRYSPVRTGRLRASIRPTASQRAGEVRMGSAKVPYAAIIEYDGRVPGGRVLGRAATQEHSEVVREYEQMIDDLVCRAGLS